VDLQLEHSRSIVTGASGGIGLACADALAREGADVVVIARDAARLSRAADSIAAEHGTRVHAVPADLSVPMEVRRAIDDGVRLLGGLDVLVNNVGASRFKPALELTDEDWVEDLELKLMCCIRASRLAVPALLDSPSGRIVNIAGMSARQPSRGHVTGAAANAAIVNFTKTLSLELGHAGILVNAVSPGPVRTERQAAYIASVADAENRTYAEVEREHLAATPLGRIAEPGEVGDVVAFLSSPRMRYIHGANIPVDGGTVLSV
jgi:3-oxoacyl-[acyl-carrier protein] reductase